MSEILFPLWLLGSAISAGWYCYAVAAGKIKMDGGAFWLVLALGPIAVAAMVGEALGKRVRRAASGMEARSVETEGLDPKDDSPAREAGTPTQGIPIEDRKP